MLWCTMRNHEERNIEETPNTSSRKYLAVATLSGLCIVVLLLTACGDKRSIVVARVGSVLITKATVDHWTSVVSRRPTSENNPQTKDETPRQRALDFLISAQWLMGEAARRGLRVTSEEIQQRLTEQKAALVTPEEYDTMLKETGKSTADVGFEIAQDLTAKKLRGAFVRELPAITEAQAEAYYMHHRERFWSPERRYFDIVEGLPSRQAALRLMSKVGHRKSFGKLAFKESLDRPTHYDANSKGTLMKAIFQAKAGTPRGPMWFNEHYAFFQVTRIVPGTYQPFMLARRTIKIRLAAAQQRDRLPRLVNEWRARWRDQTSCLPGYVVQECRQYQGKEIPQQEPFSG
jgi:hypothetical protein